MATIDDDRVQLLAGQARRLKSDLAHATDLLRDGKPDEASRILDNATGYANFVTAWLEDLARPPRDIPMRGKSRRR
ncbi:MAG TPA: hypothetical protein VFU01_13485 [Gemmatimonadaceae bacterium]|nr:hypothetical protein [Gemmatimonadaceae bacterium]